MAFDANNNQRKPLLFSDLFKTHVNTSAPEPSKLEGTSCSSSSTQFLSSYDSSSSGFSTPLYSDLESDDGDFISELTRQMECMLQENEEEEENTVDDSVSEVKNQPPVSKKGPFCRGRRVKGTESAQQKQIKKTELQYKQHYTTGRAIGYSGSGMQAVFLGGSGPRVGPPGTGVFLPRDLSELKNKSGRSCSTVLIPTRVLQVLEGLHLGKIQDSTSTTPLGGAASTSPKDKSPISTGGWEEGSGPTENDEMQLPQEWTY
ncbi:hypothetical protein ACS0TY_014789 [Phlomoides rotata]